MLKVLHVVGSRPNFMKTAPIMAEMALYPDAFQQVLVHTGQHYDDNMSKVFFDDLRMQSPDEFLNIGSGTHADQTARVMQAFEPVVLRHQPDLVVVVGDVNSTLACALVCAKLLMPVAHVEAGLRSLDRTMPEEINRILTDQISDLLFTPSLDGNENLLREGIAEAKIHHVGNVMIDTLIRFLPLAEARQAQVFELLKLEKQKYGLVTLHRPSNVDDIPTLASILRALERISTELPIIFPIHPRTRKRLDDHGLHFSERVMAVDPVGYIDFLALQQGAKVVITDSGGVQEETTYLGVPCLTVRMNTERPITVSQGTNHLVAPREDEIYAAVRAILDEPAGSYSVPDLWDGRAAQRIVSVLAKIKSDAPSSA